MVKITSDMLVAFRSTDLHPEPDTPPTYFGLYDTLTALEQDIQRRLSGPMNDEVVKVTSGPEGTVAVVREREPAERLRVEQFYVRSPDAYDMNTMPEFMASRIALLAQLVQGAAGTLHTPGGLRQYSYLSDALIAASQITDRLGWLD